MAHKTCECVVCSVSKEEKGKGGGEGRGEKRTGS